MSKIKIDNQYWLDRWETNRIFFHESDVNMDLKTYFPKLGLKKDSRIFVPLCGKSKDLLWLIDQGVEVIGVELSEIACKDFFRELNVEPDITSLDHFTKYQHGKITLLCGDLFDLTNSDLGPIDAIYDCKSLIAIPPDMRKRYIDQLIHCVGTTVKMLLFTRDTPCNVDPPPFPISSIDVESLYQDYFSIERLKHQSLIDIPERLIKKGYTEIIESVYLFSKKQR